MKKRVIIILISILSTILLIGIIFGIVILVNMNKPVANIELDGTIYETDKKEITSETKAPNNYDAKTVVAYTMWRMENINFECTTKGSSNALGITQNINNHRVVINNEAIISTVSTSSFVKVAKERFFFSDKKVLLSDASSIDSSNTTAIFSTEDPKIATKEEYIKMYGWMPYQLTGYIIAEETYLEEPTMTINEDNTYTIKMKLNPEDKKAPYWYRQEILQNSKSTIVPEFSKINIEMTIDSNYRALNVKYQESYKVEVMFKVSTTTECVDIFNYDNLSFDQDRYNFYKQYEF